MSVPASEAESKASAIINPPAEIRTQSAATHDAPAKSGWHHEIRYYVLIRVPEVRERIRDSARLAASSSPGNSFAEWLDRAHPVPDLLKPGPITALSKIYYEKEGVKTGKSDRRFFNHIS